jgi:hypothetical protein
MVLRKGSCTPIKNGDRIRLKETPGKTGQAASDEYGGNDPLIWVTWDDRSPAFTALWISVRAKTLEKIADSVESSIKNQGSA